jgi:hypothetical protein
MQTVQCYPEPPLVARFAIVLGLGLAFVVGLGGLSLSFGYIIVAAFRLLQAVIV